MKRTGSCFAIRTFPDKRSTRKEVHERKLSHLPVSFLHCAENAFCKQSCCSQWILRDTVRMFGNYCVPPYTTHDVDKMTPSFQKICAQLHCSQSCCYWRLFLMVGVVNSIYCLCHLMYENSLHSVSTCVWLSWVTWQCEQCTL